MCLTLSVTIFSQSNKPVKIIQNGDVLTSNQHHVVSQNVAWIPPQVSKSEVKNFSSNSPITVTTIEIPGGRTYYNIQSNGCVRYIWQNPNNYTQIHACFTVSNQPPNWPDRNVGYFFTSDFGVTWDYLGTVSNSRAGFPSLSALTNGRAIIACHTANATSGDVRTQVFVDIAPGAGTWTAKDPGLAGTDVPIWPSVVSTIDNGCLVTSSVNATAGPLFRNQNANLTSGNNWSGWVEIPDGENANQYSCARGGSNLGIAYLTTNGGINFIQSTDNGAIWSSPVVIRNWNPADSTGTLRSVDICYQNNQPKVFFGICKITATGYYPNRPSFMYLWSPNINGGNPVLVDSSQGLRGTGEVDVYTSVCRGTIGTSTDGNLLYVVWCRARLSDTTASGVHFFDVWFSYSTNGGLTWLEKSRITNLSGQVMDCRFPSISPLNRGPNSYPYYAHVIYQQDSIPGQISLAQMMYAKILITGGLGIKQIGSEIPSSYSLSQNYPNPFNPKTIINFQLPMVNYVNLKVYDALGREVATLVNEQLQPGTFEVDFDGSNLASGIYYYYLQTENFSDSKKMIILK